jgi:tetratricopeptide (TPR) repeat protein
MAKKIDNTEEKIHAVEDALTKSEQFIEKHQKTIYIILGAILVIGFGIYGIKKLYIEPRENEAQEQMFVAQRYFESDSLDKALKGDATFSGFIGIIDEYGRTKAANLSYYYAGIIYLKQGKFQEAIDHLKKFKSDDEIVGPMAQGALGDAYLELGNKEEALSYYEKAASKKDNELTTAMYLMRAGFVCEELGNFEKAVDLYTKIKKEHPKSQEAQDIDKYIERAKGSVK